MTWPGCSPERPLLALNGTEERLQAVIGSPSGLSGAFEEDAQGRFGEVLAPAVADMLRRAGLTARDLCGVAVARGPGSFTGLRIVLATAAGLAAGAGSVQAGVDSLPLLAMGPEIPEGGTLFVCTHSRRGQVYLQGFTSGQQGPVPLGPPDALMVDAAAALLAAAAEQGPALALGSGLRKSEAAFAAALTGSGVTVLGLEWDAPSPENLLHAALAATPGAEPPEALYLRPSDAEENLEAIAAKRGLDPARARELLALARARLLDGAEEGSRP